MLVETHFRAWAGAVFVALLLVLPACRSAPERRSGVFCQPSCGTSRPDAIQQSPRAPLEPRHERASTPDEAVSHAH